jgi:hypothetical protein
MEKVSRVSFDDAFAGVAVLEKLQTVRELVYVRLKEAILALAHPTGKGCPKVNSYIDDPSQNQR